MYHRRYGQVLNEHIWVPHHVEDLSRRRKRRGVAHLLGSESVIKPSLGKVALDLDALMLLVYFYEVEDYKADEHEVRVGDELSVGTAGTHKPVVGLRVAHNIASRAVACTLSQDEHARYQEEADRHGGHG